MKTTQLVVTAPELSILYEEIDKRCQEAELAGVTSPVTIALREKISAAIIELKRSANE